MKKQTRKKTVSICKHCRHPPNRPTSKLTSSHNSNCRACSCSNTRQSSETQQVRSTSQHHEQPFFQSTQPLTITHPLAQSFDHLYQEQGAPVITNIRIDPISDRIRHQFSNTHHLQPIDPHFTSNGLTFSPVHQSPYQKSYQTRQNSVQTPQNMSKRLDMSPTRQISSHYERVILEVEREFRDRILQLREGVQKVTDNLKYDEIIQAMRSDQQTQGFVYQRMREVVDNYVIVEQENQIGQLRNENIVLRDKLLYFESQLLSEKKANEIERTEKKLKHYKSRKGQYKKQLIECQSYLQQVMDKVKGQEQEFSKVRDQYEKQIGLLQGELGRTEKLLSDVRAQLSDKTYQGDRLASNMSQEVGSLTERIQKLEREKHELKERCQQFGEDIQGTAKKENARLTEKISNLKGKAKEWEVKCQQSENQIRDLESQLKTYLREIDQQRMKIDELVKQSKSNNYKAQDAEEKQKLFEQQLSQKLKQEKQKSKTKLTNLQQKFERAMEEKLRDIEENAKSNLQRMEEERYEFEIENKRLVERVRELEDRERKALVVQEKEYELKIDQLSERFENEIREKLGESEKQFKEMEEQLKKQHKKEKKQMIEEIEQASKTSELELFRQQQVYEASYNELQEKLRNEIQELQQRCHDMNLQIVLAQDQIRDKESELAQGIQSQNHLKEQIRNLEEKLRQRNEENDYKVKRALDDALKQQSTESLAQQLTKDIQQKNREFELESHKNQDLQRRLKQTEEQLSDLRMRYEQSQRLVHEKEYQIGRVVIQSRDQLQKLRTNVKTQCLKFKQQLEFLKKQFISEIEINKKNSEQVIQTLALKIKDLTQQQRFKLEKLSYLFEQKFTNEFIRRESEWEKAWEKRESQLQLKEQQVKDLNSKVNDLQNKLDLSELQLQQKKQQLEAQKDENLSMLSRIRKGDQKTDEILNQYRMQEEKLKVNYSQQVQEVKNKCELQAQQEIKKVEETMRQYRDQHKQKLTEVQDQLSQKETTFKQEMVHLKQVFEQKIKALEQEKQNQQEQIYQFKTTISVLQLKSEQLEKERNKFEVDYLEMRNKEKQKDLEVGEINNNLEHLNKEYEQMKFEREQMEKHIEQIQKTNNELISQNQQMNREYNDQRKKLKDAHRRIHKSRKREKKDMQILNDILTRSTYKSERKPITKQCSVYSPEFRGSQMGAQMASRRSSRSRSNQKQVEGDNYHSLMSEINSIIDQNTLKGSERKDRPRSILKNSTNQRVLSPTLLSSTFRNYQKYSTHSRAHVNIDSKENTLSISDLRKN